MGPLARPSRDVSKCSVDGTSVARVRDLSVEVRDPSVWEQGLSVGLPGHSVGARTQDLGHSAGSQISTGTNSLHAPALWTADQVRAQRSGQHALPVPNLALEQLATAVAR